MYFLNKNKKYQMCIIFLLAIMFSFFFYISKYTPFHSDDYRYFLYGMNFKSQLALYLGATGRVIGSIVSCFIMFPKSHLFAAIIKSFFACFTFSLITKIGFFQAKYSEKNAIFRVLFFILFFILFFNLFPTIGQSILWNIGAGYYLVTSSISLLFLYLLLIQNNNSCRYSYICCLLLALPAGLSHEFLALFLSLYFAYYFFTAQNISKAKLIPIGVLLAIGVAILLFAPGNYVRLHSGGSANDAYLNRSFIEQIVHFVQNDLSSVIAEFKYIILISTILLGFNYLSSKIIDRRSLEFYCFGFLFLFLMFLVPTVARRILYTPFLIFMVSISCSLATLLNNKFSSVSYRSKSFFALISILLACFYWFTMHYVAIAVSVKSTYYQQYYRDKLVSLNLDNVIIPNYYWVNEYKAGDHIDYWFDDESYAKYFNSNSKISQIDVNFDYSAIVNGKKVNAIPKDGECVTVYSKRYRALDQSTLIIELSNLLKKNELNTIVYIGDNGLGYTFYSSERNLFIDEAQKRIFMGATSKLPRACFINVVVNGKLYNLSQKVCL